MRRILTLFPAIALAVVLLLLGHDVLMSANPHMETATHDSSATDGSSPVTCVQLDLAPAMSPGIPALEAPSAATAVRSDALPHLERPSRAWRPEPDHPADVRRAFLQVFLN